MALDPDFVKRIQERKAKREALEKKYENKPARRSPKSNSGISQAGGPVYRSVSMLDGHQVTITGEEAKKKADKAKYRG